MSRTIDGNLKREGEVSSGGGGGALKMDQLHTHPPKENAVKRQRANLIFIFLTRDACNQAQVQVIMNCAMDPTMCYVLKQDSFNSYSHFLYPRDK